MKRRGVDLAELDASITSDEWRDQFVMSICPSADSTPFSSLKPCTLKALLAAIVSTPAVADPTRDHLTPTRQLRPVLRPSARLRTLRWNWLYGTVALAVSAPFLADWLKGRAPLSSPNSHLSPPGTACRKTSAAAPQLLAAMPPTGGRGPHEAVQTGFDNRPESHLAPAIHPRQTFRDSLLARPSKSYSVKRVCWDPRNPNRSTFLDRRLGTQA